MARTFRIIPEKGYNKTWGYPHKRGYCTRCGHRHCPDPDLPYGGKAMYKTKVTNATQRSILGFDLDIFFRSHELFSLSPRLLFPICI